MVYLREHIVVEQLQDERHNDTEDSGDERHLHTRSHDSRIDVARNLYLLERHHHANHRAKEAERRRHSNEKRNPRATLLKVSRLHGAVSRHRALYVLHRCVDTQQALIADRRHRSACVAALRLGALYVTRLNLRVYLAHELLCVYLRHAQIDDALDAERQAQHESQRHERHERGVALDKLLLKYLMQAAARVLRSFGYLHRHYSRRVGVLLNGGHGSLSRHLSAICRRSVGRSAKRSEQHQCNDAQRSKCVASNKISHSSCIFTKNCHKANPNCGINIVAKVVIIFLLT